MNLHLDGWDTERCAYRVVRTYTPPMTRHNFAWFLDEEEAKRFIELYKPLGDPGATDSAGGSDENV